jgi:bifunctional non-homologous end joining protein LigD
MALPQDGIALNETFTGDGTVIYKHACALGCEGIVSKRLGSPYRAGRSLAQGQGPCRTRGEARG